MTKYKPGTILEKLYLIKNYPEAGFVSDKKTQVWPKLFYSFNCVIWKFLLKSSIVNSKTVLSMFCFIENLSFCARVVSQWGVMNENIYML